MTTQPLTQCGNADCGGFFPAKWLFTADNTKGYVSPRSGKHYCSLACCVIVEGDPMQSAYQLDRPYMNGH